MARANKCDRCGQLYECYEPSNEIGDSFNAIKCVSYNSYGVPFGGEVKFDLCKECRDELFIFMNSCIRRK